MFSLIWKSKVIQFFKQKYYLEATIQKLMPNIIQLALLTLLE